MNKEITEFRQKRIDLREKSFTKEFVDKEILLDVEFNKLQCEIDKLMIYDNGGIMGVVVDLDDHNKKILSKIIKDFDAYDELIDLEYASGKEENQTDLISIIGFNDDIHFNEIRYDVEEEVFYYRGDEW